MLLELLAKIPIHVPQRLSRSNATFYTPLPCCNYIINSSIKRMLGYCNKYSLKIDLFNTTLTIIKSSILKQFLPKYLSVLYLFVFKTCYLV